MTDGTKPGGLFTVGGEVVAGDAAIPSMSSIAFFSISSIASNVSNAVFALPWKVAFIPHERQIH